MRRLKEEMPALSSRTLERVQLGEVRLYGKDPYNGSVSGIKESRIDLRLRSDQKQEIIDAASEMGISASAFIQNAALNAAREVTDQVRRIRLDEEAWQAFSDAVLGEAQPTPGLRELLSRPSVFDET